MGKYVFTNFVKGRIKCISFLVSGRNIAYIEDLT